MAAADNITTLDNSAFARIKQNARNSKARKLIHEDAKNDAHIIAERQKERSNFLKSSNSLANDAFDSMEDSYATSTNRTQQGQINEEIGAAGLQYDQMLQQRMAKLQQSMNNQVQNTMNSGLGLIQQNRIVEDAPKASNFLPKEILEQFKSNPIDAEALNPNKSVLDTIGATNDYVNEQQMAQETTTNNVIDYNMIQNIVETAVKKYAKALNKSLLNENKASNGSNNLKAMKIGNKFSFISENGDVYEAVLKFKGNIKNKK